MRPSLQFGQALDSPAQGVVEAEKELFLSARHEVRELLSFNDQPEPFNGIKVRRIERQEDRLKAPPLKHCCLMPRGIITDQEVPGPRVGHLSGGFGQEGLETDLIGVRKL